MVLGLIELLLGKKKKKPVNPVNNPFSNVNQRGFKQEMNGPQGMNNQSIGTQKQSGEQINFGNSANNQVFSQNSQNLPQQNIGGKRPISEVLHSIQKELSENNSKITELVSEVKEIQNNISELSHRVEVLEQEKKINEEKFSEIDNNMNKFLSLYELVNNQFSPFVDSEESKKVLVQNTGETSVEQNKSDDVKSLDNNNDGNPKFDIFNNDNVSSEDISFLELDTLDIKEAAGNAVPLTRFRNDTNSLVIILSWLEYLIKRVGIEETRNTLRYYTEVLKWISPEVYFELDKYLRGMKDKKNLTGDESLKIKDHIVSLYFISKLNEKPLDEKLTRAVLNLVKQ